ncbi:MAG: alpha-D-ribose 1-methylphosphonate 5-triphosphate diphosphatase [Pseudomonadota bacterium]
MRDVETDMTLAIRGADVILADEIVPADVLIVDGRIAEIGDIPGTHKVLDGRGQILAPALVDVHGDAFERQLMPRPGVFFPVDTAVLETDRQLAANGIATAFHAITLSWEPGLRAVSRGAELVQALTDMAPRLTVENRVQLRWETFAFEAIELIENALKGPLLPSIAFNDHTSMMMRSFDVAVQDRAFEQSPDFTVADLADTRMRGRVAGSARRADLEIDPYIAKLGQVWARRERVDAAIQRVASAGRAAGAAMFSHDDTQPETRAYYRALGAHIAEFPMVLEVAKAARAAGEPIIFGAPNAVRGGSHIGSLGAADMVEEGLCDALASDYYYPAMLAAVARLDAEMRASRPALWSLVSTGPARASGLMDRGEVSVGQRADLVLVDWPNGQTPAVRTTLSAGRIAYRSHAASS